MDFRKLNQVFRRELTARTPKHAELYRHYELWYHWNDFVAGLLFLGGSVLFFWSSTKHTGTWLFLVGSALFTLRPGIRLMRDLHLLRLRDGGEGRAAAATEHHGEGGRSGSRVAS